VLWRLRRANGIETALFNSVAHVSPMHEQLLLRETVGTANFSEHKLLSSGAAPDPDGGPTKKLDLESTKDIADGFVRLAALPTYPLDRLSRYEHMLWRQARQLVFTLESLRRRGRHPRRATFPFSFRRRDRDTFSK
jgi:hypothetical protein